MNTYQQDFNQTPEIFTLITGHRNEAAKQHLEKYPHEINLKGWMNDTPLHNAASSGNTEMVKYLVEHGAEVNAFRSGIYLTPLCWAANYEIAQYLLSKGAGIYERELFMATGANRTEIIDLLLTHGATIDAKAPQYLSCNSIAAMEVYLKHGIALSGCDKNTQRNLLHGFAWNGTPELFDFAYNHGCPWNKDISKDTPYMRAKQAGRKDMLAHFQQHYSTLINHSITAVDARLYSFETIYYLKQYPVNPNWFIVFTANTKLVRYVIQQQELIVDQVVYIDVPGIRSFTFNKNGELLLPTGDDCLLVIDVANFRLIKKIPLEEGLNLDQLTYLPAKNIYIGSGSQWDMTILNEDFQKIHHDDTYNGTHYPLINQQENLIAFLGYDQVTNWDLYEFPNNQEINHIHSFFETWDDHSLGFDFLNNEMAVTFHHRLEYYHFEAGAIVKQWEMDLSRYPSTYSCYVAFIDAGTMVVGKGKALFYIDKQQQKITAGENLPLTAEIVGLYVDNNKEFIIVFTNEEVKCFSIK